MAYEILFGAPQVSGVIGLDVTTNEPENGDTLTAKSVSVSQKTQWERDSRAYGSYCRSHSRSALVLWNYNT